MREEKPKTQKKSTGKGRKTLVVFGLIFILTGVFLAAFTCSFQIMIQAENESKNDQTSVEAENKRLKENVQLLQDQLTILESERDKNSSSAKPTSTAKSGSASTAKSGSASTTKSSSGSSSSSGGLYSSKSSSSNSSSGE